jgi:hypothetical protein
VVLRCLLDAARYKIAKGEEMKWKQWNLAHWVLEAEDGEVIDEVTKDYHDLFVVKSSKKTYTSEKAAKAAAEKGKKEQPK